MNPITLTVEAALNGETNHTSRDLPTSLVTLPGVGILTVCGETISILPADPQYVNSPIPVFTFDARELIRQLALVKHSTDAHEGKAVRAVKVISAPGCPDVPAQTPGKIVGTALKSAQIVFDGLGQRTIGYDSDAVAWDV